MKPKLTEHDLAIYTNAGLRNRQLMLEQLRPAQPDEWASWVDAYLRSTRKPVVRRLTRLTAEDVHVATQHLEVHPLYGAQALRIILPRGIQDWGGETGHTELFGYGEDRVTYRGFHDLRWPHQVWVYPDTELATP